jgi:hypothetical protein
MRSLLAALPLLALAAPAVAQDFDLMAIADGNSDGKVTLEEYTAFSTQGWGFVSQGKDKVKVGDLDPQAQLAFFAIQPNAEGYVTQQMYMDAIPARFKLFDADGNGSLNADELNGRALQPQQ